LYNFKGFPEKVTNEASFSATFYYFRIYHCKNIFDKANMKKAYMSVSIGIKAGTGKNVGAI
jgi:hypothetical protein